jgi:hypothetical protein
VGAAGYKEDSESPLLPIAGIILLFSLAKKFKTFYFDKIATCRLQRGLTITAVACSGDSKSPL